MSDDNLIEQRIQQIPNDVFDATNNPSHLDAPHQQLEEITIAELQAAMEKGTLTAVTLVQQYKERIAALNPHLHAILELNPEAETIAAALDEERQNKGVRSPLHGVPILLKDNIGTADQMRTTAGSWALDGFSPTDDATVAAKLRQAGAIILGKTNMSEWANFRSTQSASGWSGRGGQGRNPYMLDRSPCGSSSGSAQAVSANLVPVSLGTETDGSIVCPANSNGIVGIKPTVGLTSRFNVIPISKTQDTVGPFARTVTDAALVLGAITGIDPRDLATGRSASQFHIDYTPFLDADGLKGARIGIPRQLVTATPEAVAVFETAVSTLRHAGAEIIDPVEFPDFETLRDNTAEWELMLYEFKDGINEYLSRLDNDAPQSLADLIAFNETHIEQEMRYFGQEQFEMAQEKGPLTDSAYLESIIKSHHAARDSLNQLLDEFKLDALIAPTGNPSVCIDLINGEHVSGGSCGLAARAGFPLLTVPTGSVFGLPVNLTFMGRAFSEPLLIKLAYAFEQLTKARQTPRFLPTMSIV